jgi:hypothetical protein
MNSKIVLINGDPLLGISKQEFVVCLVVFLCHFEVELLRSFQDKYFPGFLNQNLIKEHLDIFAFLSVKFHSQSKQNTGFLSWSPSPKLVEIRTSEEK